MPPLKNRILHGKTVNNVSKYYMQVIIVQNEHANLELVLNPRHWKGSDELNFSSKCKDSSC